jgi:tetratricopeptide (TPR) repeat protein
MGLMKQMIATLLFLLVLWPAAAQDAKASYEKALELAQKGEAEAALKYFDQSIALKPDEYVAWYNRGITYLMLHRYEEALADMEQTLRLSPGYKKAYLNRGNAPTVRPTTSAACSMICWASAYRPAWISSARCIWASKTPKYKWSAARKTLPAIHRSMLSCGSRARQRVISMGSAQNIR